jgi:hypothetical protein
MRNHFRVLSLGLLLSLAAVPQLGAQINPLVELYGGYNYAKTTPQPAAPKTDLSGFVFGVSPFATKWFGATFELSKQYGTIGSSNATYANASIHESSFLAGPTFRVLNRDRVTASVKTLLGGTQGQVMLPASTASETRFTVMLGGSVDVGVNKWLAFRVEPGLFRTSFASQNQNALRISFGPVFRFGSLPEH